jgi:hypothetical protein
MINTLLSITVIMIMLYELTQSRDAFNQCERIGLGLIGGGVLMRITVWWSKDSPFDGWAAAVTLVGMILYFGGRSWRNHIHARNNKKAVEDAKRHLQRRNG